MSQLKTKHAKYAIAKDQLLSYHRVHMIHSMREDRGHMGNTNFTNIITIQRVAKNSKPVGEQIYIYIYFDISLPITTSNRVYVQQKQYTRTSIN